MQAVGHDRDVIEVAEQRGTICSTVLPASRMIESPSWM